MFLTLLLSSLLTSSSVEAELILGEEPLADHQVYLLALSSGKAEEIERKKTNQNGRVKFQLPEENQNERYSIVTSIDGLAYYSEIFSPSRPMKKLYRIQTYPTAEQLDEVFVSELSIMIIKQGVELSIEESFVINNPTSKTLRGQRIAGSEGQYEAFRFSIPSQAFNLRYGFGFEQGSIGYDGDSVLQKKPVYPGRTYHSLSYELDKPRISVDLGREFSIPVKKLSIASNDSDLRLKGVPLQAKGQRLFRGESLYLYEAQLDGQKQIDLVLAGLPLNLPLSWFVPVLGVLFIIFSLSLKSASQPHSPGELNMNKKSELLKELALVKQLKERGLIDASEFQRRKLDLLKMLSIYYQS